MKGKTSHGRADKELRSPPALSTAAGDFEVDIGPPLDVEEQPDGKSARVAAPQQYAETLEPYVLEFPGLPPNRGYLAVDWGDHRS